MGKILSLVLGLAIIGYLGYRTMYGRSTPGAEPEAPKQRLENVQKAADRIEANDEARLKAIEQNAVSD